MPGLYMSCVSHRVVGGEGGGDRQDHGAGEPGAEGPPLPLRHHGRAVRPFGEPSPTVACGRADPLPLAHSHKHSVSTSTILQRATIETACRAFARRSHTRPCTSSTQTDRWVHWMLQRMPCVSRGRADRMAFAKTFEPAYHFRLLYLPGVLYPIMGALRYCAGESWQVRVFGITRPCCFSSRCTSRPQ